MTRSRPVLLLLASAALGVALASCSTEETPVSGVAAPTSPPTSVVLADAIPIANTPPGGWTTNVPAPVLATCTETLVGGAPDLRGVWKVARAERGGLPVSESEAIYDHVQRVEQCGDRLVVTAGGIIHDMRVDGTEENGVHDVAERDYATPITVVATYENGVHVLRPVGLPVEVTRRLDADGNLVWEYLGTTVTLERIGEPTAGLPPLA